MNLSRLRAFIADMTKVTTEPAVEEMRLLDAGSELLAELVSHDDWLPDPFASPASGRYQQYLLHCDPLERLSVVSFVWGPGQTTPIHDHTVWGLIGVLRGVETCEEFSLRDGVLHLEGTHVLETGQVDRVSPTIGDIHRVSNARQEGSSISIHVYGANIGAVRRHSFDRDGGQREFISGYSSAVMPNPWDRSREIVARGEG